MWGRGVGPSAGRHERGTAAERRAEAELVRRGYRVVERNYRARLGELDLIAYDGDVLVFVEVRSRADARHGGGLAAVPHAKQRQVARVAALYLAHRRPKFSSCRFDVVAITGADLVVIPGAFHITW
ncbi:MAG: YraN family protein [Myxococcales bacterium]|nr:YraN family protein [Myxococcales bacterium]